MVDGLLQIRGSCSQGTLPDKGLHLHESAPDCHHLRLCTVESEDDLAACWGPIAQVKHPANVFQGKLLLHWASQVVLVWIQMPEIPL